MTNNSTNSTIFISRTADRKFEGNAQLIRFLRRIFTYWKNHPRWLYAFIISIVAVAFTDASFPFLWQQFLDKAIQPALKNNEVFAIASNKIFFGIALFFGFGVLQVLGVYVFVKIGGSMQERVMYQLRREMFVKLQHLSFAFYDKTASGWLLSRLGSDTERVTEMISWGFLESLWGVNMICICVAFMLWYSVTLGLIIFISLPLIFVIAIYINRLILKYSRQVRRYNSDITASYTEHINGLLVNKITAQEERVIAEFGILTAQMQRSSYKSQFYTAAFPPIIILIASFTSGLVLYMGGQMASAQPPAISIGTLAAFFGYATQIFIPILDISRFYAQAQGCLSAGERIFSLIDEKISIQDASPNLPNFNRIKGDITFQNVDFEYINNKPVIQNFNLHIQAGQSVALVGATGEGKSTITNLICRFYEPTAGAILIDGINYTERTLHSLRSQIGVMLQTPHLFAGTILENILYGRSNASKSEIIEALEAVAAQNFINKLDEQVGENGDSLSIGEKQQISFARALLSKPQILIMDEATSSIDTLTETLVQQGIQKMLKNRTCIIVAHRLSTIKNCDRILVIKQGKIIEDGSHKALMQQKGAYFNLYTKQLQEEKMQ